MSINILPYLKWPAKLRPMLYFYLFVSVFTPNTLTESASKGDNPRIRPCCPSETMLGHINTENFGDSISTCGSIFHRPNVTFNPKAKFTIDALKL